MKNISKKEKKWVDFKSFASVNLLSNNLAFLQQVNLGWHLAVVEKLVCLNDPESCVGGDFGPWQV